MFLILRSLCFYILVAWMAASSIPHLALGESASRKAIQFLPVEHGKAGDPRCLEPRDPCFIPSAMAGVSTQHYLAKPVVGSLNAISLTFDESDGKEVSRLMNGHIGKRIALIVDGKLIQAPVVKTRIEGNQMQISSPELETNQSLRTALGITGT
jgi:hypothetical protein